MDAKKIIKKHLDGMAEKDEAFRAAYENPKKNLEDCFTYILNQARSHGNAVCMSDEEVFGMAVHYYVEADIEVGKRPRADVAVKEREKAVELTDEEKGELKEKAKEIMKSGTPTSVLDEDKPQRNGEHPTMKPLKLIGRLIKNSSRIGEIILDTFGGSGSTMMAAEQLNRKCYMIEYDPHYCDVIIARWEKLTGKKAVKIN